MRALITALSLAFLLGGLAPAVQADCGAEHAKKNDFETPPPAASTVKKDEKKG